MTRDEQIRQTAISEQKGLMESCDWRGGFVSGAKWADNTMINKACEWLKNNFVNGREMGCDAGAMHKKFKYIEEIIPSFIKAMEE